MEIDMANCIFSLWGKRCAYQEAPSLSLLTASRGRATTCSPSAIHTTSGDTTVTSASPGKGSVDCFGGRTMINKI